MKVKEIKISEIVLGDEILRDYAEPEKLEELKESMRQYGLLHPIVVRKVPEGYKLIAGLRRTVSARELGWETIPAYILEEGDESVDDILTLEENIKREDVTPVQEGKWFKYLMSKGNTMEEIARKIGKSESYVRQRVELVEAEKDLQDAVERGEMSFSVAREIMGIKDPETREYVKKLAIESGANVEMVKMWKKDIEEQKKAREEVYIPSYQESGTEEVKEPTFICPVCRQEHPLGTGISLVLCPDCYRIVVEQLKEG